MDCDVAVLGGGPAGYTAAIRAAQLGGKVVCIETSRRSAGTCLRVGCIPTKAWVQTAHALHDAEERSRSSVSGLGAAARLRPGGSLEGRVVKQMTGGVASLFKAYGVAWARGTDGSRVRTRSRSRVARTSLSSARSATGSYPMRPPIPGLDAPRCVDSTGLLAQTEVPRRLVVLGGGIIGCEFASIFQRFGREVTIIEMLPTLIPQEDADAAKELAKAFKRRGITVHLEQQCTASRSDEGHLVVQFGEVESVEADLMLVAVGRAPLVQGLGLDEIGVGDRPAQRGSRPTSTCVPRFRTSMPSATWRGGGSSRTPASARARSLPRTRWATRRRSAIRPCRA